MSIEIQLTNFAGPLDLLLHLIKTNEMDINDIPMVEITEQYLQVIEQMKQLDLDIAGEFLLMAATLIHIKSRLLLPVPEEVIDEEEVDPRAELVRRLLEYQRYKAAAVSLDRLPQLERDVFLGQLLSTEPVAAEGSDADEEIKVGIFQLARAFHRLLKQLPLETFHEVIREPFSVAEFIQILSQRLVASGRLAFRELFTLQAGKGELVVTFLAMLELVKMRLVKIEQAAEFSEIWLSLAVPAEALAELSVDEGSLGYG
jgi:segregation and condensation protein A